MRRGPNRFDAYYLINEAEKRFKHSTINIGDALEACWVPTRPLGLISLQNRLRLAWEDFVWWVTYHPAIKPGKVYFLGKPKFIGEFPVRKEDK